MQDATPEVPNSVAQRDRLQRIRADGYTGTLTHCVTTAVELRGTVDACVLQARLADVVRRRPALGSVFEGNDVHSPVGGHLELRRRLVTGPDAERRWCAAREIADAEAQRPFAVGEHPLIRALLLDAGDDRHLLVLTVDQLVGDAWSSNLLVNDLIQGTAQPPDAYPVVWPRRVGWLAGPTGQAAVTRRLGSRTSRSERG